MTGTFKANNPYNTFLLLVYGLLLKLHMFLYPVIPTPQQTDGFLFKALLEQLSGLGKSIPAIYPAIVFVLLYTQAIAFNKLVIDQRLMSKPNYLTAMSYLLITSLFSEWSVLSAPLIINTLLIWVWARMSGLYNNQKPKASLFNIGVAIGISTFFYFPSIAFSALIVFGLVVTRPFKLAEWLIALLGIFTPYYFVLAWAFLTDKLHGYKFPGIAISFPKFYESSWALAAIIIVLFATVIGLYFIQKNFLRQLVQSRKSWQLVFLYFLVAVFIPFINATHTFHYWILCAVPLSAFVACAFLYPQKKWFPTLLHWLMVAFVIAFSYFVK
ncbi:DUF6427 family protein [Ferruginibacter lapsinanis]|uniref:DUF6427 family protein n=1 Tax=Ferruginibacter lapsinanis TaxID=563172 RepID=UPI001E473B2C|nr:DUF6427 family protein [Ferruginibacter lapsinanis]UEG50276.1 DUF6427 family protein [Ferruginibacter lapsinanis]